MSKRVLITGAAGFIGAHILEYLLNKTDWEFVLLDRLDTSGTLNRVKDVLQGRSDVTRVKFVWHDLKAPINDLTANAIGTVDYVIHLAASSHVDRSIEDPVLFAMDNVVGTTNLLNWARKGGLAHEVLPDGTLRFTGKFINFSTDEVFGPAENGHAHHEEEPHKPSNPYAASKSGQEAMGYAFYVTYHLPVITTHTMNNFGERQHSEKLVPKAIRSIIEGTPMPIFAELDEKGELQAVGSRYWIHCVNTANAVLFLLDKGVAGESYNIIGFDELTNLEIAEKIAAIIGKPLIPKFVDFHKTRPGHDRRYALDGTKMRDLGWVPEVSFEESLKRTVEFTLANPNWQ